MKNRRVNKLSTERINILCVKSLESVLSIVIFLGQSLEHNYSSEKKDINLSLLKYKTFSQGFANWSLSSTWILVHGLYLGSTTKIRARSQTMRLFRATLYLQDGWARGIVLESASEWVDPGEVFALSLLLRSLAHTYITILRCPRARWRSRNNLDNEMLYVRCRNLFPHFVFKRDNWQANERVSARSTELISFSWKIDSPSELGDLFSVLRWRVKSSLWYSMANGIIAIFQYLRLPFLS